MKIGEAIDLAQTGKKVTRKGWNGKGVFLYYVPAASYPAQTEAAKEHFGELVPYAPYIAMKTAQGYVVPWLANQTDLLADDYEEYQPVPIIDPNWKEDRDPLKEIIESLSFVRSI